MRNEYFIAESGYSEEHQKDRHLITGYRIEKVIDYLTFENPNLIPFQIKTPIVPYLDLKSFEKQTKKAHYFDDLPRHIKETVRKAEKMKFFDLQFRKYLFDRDISSKDFKAKNPKSKEDLFYDWLFMNNLDIDVLNI